MNKSNIPKSRIFKDANDQVSENCLIERKIERDIDSEAFNSERIITTIDPRLKFVRTEYTSLCILRTVVFHGDGECCLQRQFILRGLLNVTRVNTRI